MNDMTFAIVTLMLIVVAITIIIEVGYWLSLFKLIRELFKFFKKNKNE